MVSRFLFAALLVVVGCVGLSLADEAESRKFSSKVEFPENKSSPDNMIPINPPSPAKMPEQPFKSSFSMQKILGTVLSMFSGKADDSFTNQIISMLLSFIDTLRNSFSARKAQARSSTGAGISSYSNDAVVTGLTLVKAYVRSLMATDEQCVQKFLCQANREAVMQGNEIGSMVSNAGSSAVSYLLQRSKSISGDLMLESSKLGRTGSDCDTLYALCQEHL